MLNGVIFIIELILIIVASISLSFILKKEENLGEKGLLQRKKLLLWIILIASTGIFLYSVFFFNLSYLVITKVGLLILPLYCVYTLAKEEYKVDLNLIDKITIGTSIIMIIGGVVMYFSAFRIADTYSRQEIIEYEYITVLDFEHLSDEKKLFYYRLEEGDQTVTIFTVDKKGIKENSLKITDIDIQDIPNDGRKKFRIIKNYYDELNYNKNPPVVKTKECSSSTTYELDILNEK